MIRKILVPIRGDGKGENVLWHAALLAKRFDAHIEATHCRPRPEDMLPYGVPIPAFLRDQMREQVVSVADAEETRLRAEFDAVVASFGLTQVEAAAADGPSISWIEEAGKQIDVIKRHGRLCDVVAVAKPDRDRNLGANTLKTALFNTGRPVLMCPPTDEPPAQLGEKVAIAWNGSLEASRAVAMTMGLIERASEVCVITAGPGEVHGAPRDALIPYLAIRGVTAEHRVIAPSGRVGEALLSEAQAAGADLLIMGAYGDSHERETIFGGNTQVVVDNATMPVMLVH